MLIPAVSSEIVYMHKSVLPNRIVPDSFLKLAVQQAQEGIFVKDKTGKYIYANKAVAKLFGQPLSKILGAHDVQFLPSKIATQINEADDLVFSTNQTQTLEITGKFNGVEKSILTTKVPYQDIDKEIIGLVGIMRDITSLKKTKVNEKILGIEQKLRLQAEESRDKLYRLQYYTTALSQAPTPKEIAEITVNIGAATLDATAGTVWLFNDTGDLELMASMGYARQDLDRIPAFRQQGSTATLDAIQTGKPILLRSLKDRQQMYPQTITAFNMHSLAKNAFIAIPLIINKKKLGAINFAFSANKNFLSEEREFMLTVADQCAQALDRAKLYEKEKKNSLRIQQIAEKTKLLQEITSAVGKSTDAKQIIEIIVEKGSSLLEADAIDILYINELEKKGKVIASKGYGKNSIQIIETGDHTLSLKTLHSGEPLFIENTSHIASSEILATALVKQGSFSSVAIIPLLTRNRKFGTISFAFKNANSFAQEDKDFMQTLASECAQALELAEDYTKEKKQKEDLEYAKDRINTLQKVTSLLSKALTVEEMSEIIIQGGIDALGAIAGEISTVSNDKKKIKLIASVGYPKVYKEQIHEDGAELNTDQPLLMMDVIKEGKPKFISNLSNIPKKYKAVQKTVEFTPFRSGAFVPLKTESKTLGCLALLFEDTEAFRQEDIDFLTTLVKQFSAAFDRAMLYESEKKQREELEYANERLQALQDVTASLSQAVTSTDILETIINRAMKVVNAVGGEVALIDESKKHFKIIAYTGYPLEYKVNFKKEWQIIPSGKRMLMWDSFNTRKPIFVADLQQLVDKYESVKKFLSISGYRSEAIIPLSINNKAFGIFLMFFQEPGEFTKAEEEFIIAIGNYISQAWERVQSYERDRQFTQELEKREARFRALIENSSDATVILDKSYRITYSSPSTLKITGSTPEERQGKNVLEAIYSEDKGKVKKFISYLIAHPSATLSLRYRRVNKDGPVAWMEAIGTNQFDNQNIRGILVHYRNINDTVMAEEAIRRSKEELEVILQNVTDAVIVRDPKGKMLYANTAAVKINRFNSLEEYKQLSYQEYFSRFSEVTNEEGEILSIKDMPIMRLIRGEKLRTMIVKVVYKDTGEEQWRRTSSAGIFDENGKLQFSVTVTQDITEEKRKEQLKDEFISTASHELKTPITSAKLYASLLLQRLHNKQDEESFTILTKIDVQLERLTRLIGDLLDITKIRAGKLQMKKEHVQIMPFIEELVDEMQYSTLHHKLKIYGKIEGTILIDKERMRQAIINLLSNAIKYSPNAKEIDVLISAKTPYLRIAIKDYGVGITRANKEKIFEPFFREVSENSRFPGLGLGLHISNEIVKRHGGKIDVESTLGKGSVFTIYIPL